MTTYSQVVQTLLDTYAPDDVITEADDALQDLKTKPSQTQKNFAATLMSKLLRFVGVYGKLQL